MDRRAIYRRKRFWVGLLAMLVLVIVGGLVMWGPSRGELNARRRGMSVDGEFTAFALPVSGNDTRGVKGGLMVYLMSEKSVVIDRRATSLRGTRVTRLEWDAGEEKRSFRIWDEEGTRMVWRVVDGRLVCVEGMGFLVGE